MDWDFATSSFVTLLVTVDPVGLIPAFLSLTHDLSRAQAKRVAVMASLIALAVLVAFALAGEFVLRQLGIGLAAFRIAGGLLLFWIAFEMVFERRAARKQATAEVAVTEDHVRNVGKLVLSRLLGVILAALAVQFVINGLTALL